MTTTIAPKDGLSISQTCVIQNQTRKSTENFNATTEVGGGARVVYDDDDDNGQDDDDDDSSDDGEKEESLTAILFPLPLKFKLPSPPTSSSSASLITTLSSSSTLAISPPPPPPPPPSSPQESPPSPSSPLELPPTSPTPCTSTCQYHASGTSSPPSCTCVVFPSSSSSSSSLSSSSSSLSLVGAAAASSRRRRRRKRQPPPLPPPPPTTLPPKQQPLPPPPSSRAEGGDADMAVLAQPFDLQSPLTEIDMLRAQQREKSAEIMALKNELDNRRCRLQTMETVHEELNAFKTDAEKQKMVRAADILAMEKDFQQLSKRHDRLMNVKDSVKEKNRLLEERISQMSVENPNKLSKVLKEKSLLVQQLNKSVAKTKLKLKNLETVYSQKLFEVENNSELERAKLLQSVHTRTKYELKKKIDSAKTEMEVNQKALKEAVMERKKNEEENFRRRDLLIKQRYEAERRTEELCQQIKEVKADRMQHEKDYLEVKKKYMTIKGGFMAQEWKTDKEANIKELKKQLATLKMAQHEAAKAFLAFKDHTNHLINRERTLNRKFSEISGKYTSSSYQ